MKTSSATSRRSFLQTIGLGAAALGLKPVAHAAEKVIPGFEKTAADANTSKGWKPVSDRKIRVGIAGYGLCKFGAAFGFQDHPNVQVVAVSDLIPERSAGLAKDCRCDKTYPSLEEMVKDDSIEAVFVATDAPSHARHCIEVLKHGKHVATAVPAVWGSLEDAERVFEVVKTSGKKYMMFETSCYHPELHAMREIYKAGGFGKLIYAEGEYYHTMPAPLASYKDWRVGLPPQWYPTHATAYYVGVTGGSFTEVSCLGMPSKIPHLQAANNRYKNPFGTEIASLRTSEGGMARMAVSWDIFNTGREAGRIFGQQGTYEHKFQQGTYGSKYQGVMKELPASATRPPLPPSVQPGGHGGSHGYLMNEFVTAVLENRQPLVNIAWALNMTVAGIVAHQSALKDGELLKIPQFKL
jgi:predicted dehydrogenase